MSLEKFPDFLLNFSVPEIDGKETRSFAFKSFRLDLSERQLVNAGVPVPLTPKAFDVLAFLVIRGGHLVEKDELLRAVWADSFVEEANVARIIHTLRKILGEDQNGNKFIETVAKKGYRFVAEVTPDDGPHGHSHENAGALDIWPTDLIDVSDPPQTAAEAKFYSDQKISRRPILTGLAVVLALFLISFLVFGWNGGKPAIVSIAILPFRSVTNENQEYKLGIADSLISRLISAKNLTVRPLASTWKYLDSEIDPVAAGKEQNVDFTVASSLQVAEGKIRVTSQLINVKSGAVVETFQSERDVGRAFETEDAIAAEVGRLILKHFGTSAGDLVEKRGTASEEAYRYVLQAAYTIDNNRTTGPAMALELLDKAVALDPNYARAYAVRAWAYRSFAWQPSLGISAQDWYLRGKEAVETALRLDPNSSDAYAMLGEIKDTYEWKSDEADAAHRRSIELDPNSAHAHRLYALFLMNCGRFDEADKQIKTAIEIDPGSLFGQRMLGQVMHREYRYDEAIAQLHRVIEMNPNFREGSGMIWRSYFLKGDRETAYTEFHKMVEIEIKRKNVETDKLARMEDTYAKNGWDGIFHYEAELLENGGDADIQAAVVYTGLGDHDKAIAALKKIADARNRAQVVFMGPWLDPLRQEPRFQALIKRVGY